MIINNNQHKVNRLIQTVFFVSIGLALCSCADNRLLKKQKAMQRPNVIYILADDLGYGDLGCFGQRQIETPNIDRLAAQGAKFNYHFSGSTVCAPSRSSLLTGLHTGHTPIRGNKEYFPEGQQAMPDTVMTTAKFFKGQGYITAAMGKWGLGFVNTQGDPKNQGFDTFFGYNCQREAHRYYPDHLWSNSERIELTGNDLTSTEIYAQDVIHQKALDFIRDHKDSSFYLYLPYIAPHAELIAPEDSLLQYYRSKFQDDPGKPYVAKEGGDYGPDMVIGRYASQDEPRAHFAAMVARLDVYVGQILALLKETGLAENTLVIFTSDNGPHQEAGADPDFFNSNAGLRGYKRDLYEGGVRVPFVAYLPSRIPAGTVSNTISAFWDMNATYAEMLGVQYPATTDGISFWPSMTGGNQSEEQAFLYWEFHEKGGRQAIRKGQFKLVKLNVKKPEKTSVELYNLDLDPKEENNIADENPELVASLTRAMEAQHTANSVFPFYPDEGKSTDKPYYVE